MAWTYATLTQAIQDFTENAETTFTDNIPVFIKSTEERLMDAVDLNLFRKNSTGATVNGNPLLTVPTDYLSSVSLAINDEFMMNKDPEYVQDYGGSGVPKYYGQYDITTFVLAPTPDAVYTVKFHYRYKPTSIVSSGTSWFGTNAEQAMLYGALVEAYIFMKGEADIINMYQQRLTEAIMRLKNYGEGREDVDQYREGLIRIKAT